MKSFCTDISRKKKTHSATCRLVIICSNKAHPHSKERLAFPALVLKCSTADNGHKLRPLDSPAPYFCKPFPVLRAVGCAAPRACVRTCVIKIRMLSSSVRVCTRVEVLESWISSAFLPPAHVHSFRGQELHLICI